jgi:uncharacterized RDD family membrane protein YckC
MISDAQLDHPHTGQLPGQLAIDTPELVALHLPIAGIGSRFLAVLTDSAIQVGAILAVLLLLALLSFSLPQAVSSVSDAAGKWFVAAIGLFFFLLIWGYFSLFEAYWNGQTPGKRLLKIRVIKDSGRQITLFEALARNLLRPVDYFPALYLTGVIAMLCNRQQKRLGDLVAGTLVVHEPTESQPLLTHNSRTFTAPLTPVAPDSITPTPLELAALQAAELFPADAIARLNHGDLNVMETFFARALDLDPGRRNEMALRIATRLCYRMDLPLPESPAPERLLEAIAHAMRSQSRH